MSQPDNAAENAIDAAGHGSGLNFPQTRISSILEAGLGAVSYILNSIWIILVMIIVVNVTMRYVFNVNNVWVEEVQWHLYAVGFMFGIGYAILHDAHVRVDAMAANFRPATRAWIELFMIALILLPMSYIMVSYAIPFVELSYRRGETSSAPGGLTHRWMIKSVIVLAFAYIGIAAFARLTRVTSFLFAFPRSLPHRPN